MNGSGQVAYSGVERELARQVREAALDHDAFAMPLKVCELSACRATCCHDGVFLDAEQEAEIARQVGRLEKYGFHRSGWRELRNGRVKTATVGAGEELLAEGFPDHFPRSRCVFLDDRHRCLLQRLALDEDRHPWWWKPVSCWMHPLLLGRRDGRPWLTLARPGSDPTAADGYPGFASFTPCGMSCAAGGEPAWRALRGELELLGRIGGRDLVRELA